MRPLILRRNATVVTPETLPKGTVVQAFEDPHVLGPEYVRVLHRGKIALVAAADLRIPAVPLDDARPRKRKKSRR